MAVLIELKFDMYTIGSLHDASIDFGVCWTVFSQEYKKESTHIVGHHRLHYINFNDDRHHQLNWKNYEN